MSETGLSALFLLLVSPLAGSFVALLADRLPRGEDVVVARSACRSCATPLGPRDLIPLLSFALGRGRCRHCGAQIPPVLLYAELIAIGAAVLAVIAVPQAGLMWLCAALLWVLLGLALADLQHFRLPDPLTATLFALALLWVWLSGGALDLALLGAAIGSGSFLALRIAYRALRGREGLGLGDVKLMAGLGALSGPLDLPLLVLISALLALAGAGIGALLGRGDLGATRPLPFGVALCAGGALLWITSLMPI